MHLLNDQDLKKSENAHDVEPQIKLEKEQNRIIFYILL